MTLIELNVLLGYDPNFRASGRVIVCTNKSLNMTSYQLSVVTDSIAILKPSVAQLRGGWRGLEHPSEQNWGALQFVQIRRLFLEGGAGGGVARVGHTEWLSSTTNRTIIAHISKQFYKL
jgi:hypothetical protein